MAKNHFSCADIRFRESKSAPTSSAKTAKKPIRPYIEPKFRRGQPEEHDGLQVWQCKRDQNYRGYGNQLYHDKNAHPRFYPTKQMIVHQRGKVVSKTAKKNIGRMYEDHRRDQRARQVDESFNNAPRAVEFSGFMGCSLKNKTPILDYAAAECVDKDFTFSGVVSVDEDIKYNCSFFPSNGAKMIDVRRYKDYVDLFVNYSGKQAWQLDDPCRPKIEKAGLFWSNARTFRQTHPLNNKTEWDGGEEIVPAPLEPNFIPPTGIDDDAVSTVSCSTLVAPSSISTVVEAAVPKNVLPTVVQKEVLVVLSSTDTSDEAESCISEHSLPPHKVLIEKDSSSDDNLEITIPDLPEAIFADAVGIFDDSEEDSDKTIPLPWAVPDQSMDVEVGEGSVENSVQEPLVVMPPTVAPAQVLKKVYKHPFISNESQSDGWSSNEEHETYLAYGTELPLSPYELPLDPFESLTITELKNKFIKERLGSSGEWLKVKLENFELSNCNRDLKFENETWKNATSAKTLANLLEKTRNLEESVELWRSRAIEKTSKVSILAVSLSAVHDVLDNLLWSRGASPLRFTVNSEPTFDPRFGDQKQVIAKQVLKDESRSCPNTSDKCDPTSRHQCYNCISSFRISACMAIVLDGLLKSETSITEFQRISSNPSTMAMLEYQYATQKRPSEASTPNSAKSKLTKRSPEQKVLSNDLTKMSIPTFTDAARFTQSSPKEVSNVNNKTIDDRRTQDFEINVHASDSDESADYDPR